MTSKLLSDEIRGLQETQKKTEQTLRDLKGEPFLEGMRDATLYVQRDARINAPVDTGRLRASITPEIRSFGDTIQGVVGSNVTYAPYQELGTKWMKAKLYLRRALESNKDRIMKRLNDAVSKIVRK